MNRGVTPGPAGSAQPRIIGGTGQTFRIPVLGDILDDVTDTDIQQEDLRRRVQIIEQTLLGFGVPVSVVEVNQGPAVTQFGLRPGIIVRKDRKGEEKHIKVRVSQIQALSNDLSLALAASPIRIEAPVPGRDFVGIEVPNVQISLVSLRGVMESEEWPATKGVLKFGLGRDVSGQAAVADLARMPHMLIAGATGSGKSVCVNAIITSLLLTHTPDTLALSDGRPEARRTDRLQRHPAPDRARRGRRRTRGARAPVGHEGDGAALQAVRQDGRAQHRGL